MEHTERLRVPGGWWAMAAVAVLALFIAYDVSLGLVPALLAAALLGCAATAWLLRQSRLAVMADDHGLHAGPALLPPQAIGTVEALDADATRRARGPLADPHAFYLLRGYVGTAVRVWVDDPRDPVPYWLVSSRHPQRLAAALADVRDRTRLSAS